MNAIDTNVLIYSVDRNEPIKQLEATQLLQQVHAAAEQAKGVLAKTTREVQPAVRHRFQLRTA